MFCHPGLDSGSDITGFHIPYSYRDGMTRFINIIK